MERLHRWHPRYVTVAFIDGFSVCNDFWYLQDGKDTVLNVAQDVKHGQIFSCKIILLIYNVIAFAASFMFVYLNLASYSVIFPVALTILLIYFAYVISTYPENEDPHKTEQYRVPYMPYPPLIGIYINYFLVAQLEWWGILMIFGYFGLATVVYFIYGVKNSVGNTTGWSALLNEVHLSDQDDIDESDNAVLLSNDAEVRKIPILL